jgi:hypothetical protein
MTAAEHLRAAEQETEAAAMEFDIARHKMGERSPLAPPDRAPYEGPEYPSHYSSFFDPAWDPQRPEHYVFDPKPRVLGGANAEAGRRHLEQAERHRRAAAALQGERRNR